ncbi:MULTISPECIES: methyltransferase domain-containing protein [unclassified Moorena]|uniref:class I SAM-dependent methyltransferase n=1 Tax=unclassified Moorena TaxID=2683338 RepID=UPI0013FE98DB|nr:MULTISPECIES: methyltransferase domain-containing protein [unclassified Moorena]NEO12162.1 methyltransferase domain-containing protein [Moorena sp. SIO3E8]NEQ00924.1 methyltransferase domain-containing protein [Moorena sp. SIO3F7]
MNSKNQIHLVMGVSSAGKSTYIESRMKNGEWNDIPVRFPVELNHPLRGYLLNQNCIIHYNLYRPYNNNVDHLVDDFMVDPALVKILNYRERIRAYILVAPRSELVKRCLLRTTIEPTFRKNLTHRYSPKIILDLLCRLNLTDFYKKWFLLLRQYEITFEIINSADNYLPISSISEALDLLSLEQPTHYSQQELDYIVDNNMFGHQKIEVYPNKFTPGQDRSANLIVLDQDLTGKSVLDIGCAYGYFCFEAEKRNASRVVGTEVKRHRFRGCNILKEILGKSSVFLEQDIFTDPLNEKFDIVLLLNVIHQLKEPIKALRTISQLCNEKLIIEFPTLSDQRFKSTISSSIISGLQNLLDRDRSDSSLPLIGVSLNSTKDQTFLFSKEALKRILVEHDNLFKEIEFKQSKISPESTIAICYK